MFELCIANFAVFIFVKSINEQLDVFAGSVQAVFDHQILKLKRKGNVRFK